MNRVGIFFLTVNSVSEAMYYKLNSIKKEILELILQLVYLELTGCFKLYIIWVAGTRKITAGIDSFPRGCLKYGIASSGYI